MLLSRVRELWLGSLGLPRSGDSSCLKPGEAVGCWQAEFLTLHGLTQGLSLRGWMLVSPCMELAIQVPAPPKAFVLLHFCPGIPTGAETAKGTKDAALAITAKQHHAVCFVCVVCACVRVSASCVHVWVCVSVSCVHVFLRPVCTCARVSVSCVHMCKCSCRMFTCACISASCVLMRFCIVCARLRVSVLRVHVCPCVTASCVHVCTCFCVVCAHVQVFLCHICTCACVSASCVHVHFCVLCAHVCVFLHRVCRCACVSLSCVHVCPCVTVSCVNVCVRFCIVCARVCMFLHRVCTYARAFLCHVCTHLLLCHTLPVFSWMIAGKHTEAPSPTPAHFTSCPDTPP